MTDLSHQERLTDLAMERADALGQILGLIDTLMLAEEHPDVFSMKNTLRKLYEARLAYDEATEAYLDERRAG